MEVENRTECNHSAGMMRAVPFLALVLLADTAQAVSLQGERPMACREIESYRRMDKAAGAGDRGAVLALITEALKTGACFETSEGMRVRIEDRAFPYLCVVKFGTTAPCMWVPQKNVNLRD